MTDNILAHNSRTRILPDMGLVVKYQQQYSFHFRLFPRKTNDKIFQKIEKPYFGAILGPFSWSKGLSVVRYSNYLPSYKKSAKTIEPFLRKTPSWRVDTRTDGQTDNGDFIGPSVGRGPTRASMANLRSSRSLIFFKIGVLKKFAQFHRKTPVLQSLFITLITFKQLYLEETPTQWFSC